MPQGYDPYLVYRDTREKDGWEFTQSGYCAGTEEKAIKTGDYTLYGYEQHLCIERKGSVTELAMNITQPRFERELERMQEIPWRYIILEFDMHNVVEFPRGTKIPAYKKKFMKVRGPFLLKRILELQKQYDVPFVFCGKYAKEVCSSIFKRFMETQNKYDRK
tara:strand:+ start:370 stop:855 length:486 start_codon:yes stop_codon:yes gene_type:complete